MQLSRQQVEAVREFRRYVGQREGIDPTGRQLDRQRHSVDQSANLGHYAQLIPGGRERQSQPLGALHEQRHGTGEFCTSIVHYIQPMQEVNVLLSQFHALSCRDQNHHHRCCGEQSGHQFGGIARVSCTFVEQMFQIVDY